jgi:heme/copper-type cytochrome/quinol oxidase subunit 3
MKGADPRLDVEGARVIGDVVDVREMPSYGFGTRSVMYWGTLGVVAIEGTVFLMALVSYFYLRAQAQTWPLGVPPPDLAAGTFNTLILLASLLPNHWTQRAAKRHDLTQVRVGMVICIAFALVFLIVRIFEFKAMHVGWDENAYGSLVWLLLGLHTVHLITDFADTVVLAALLFTGPIEGRRYVDVYENAMYWDFVVLAWIPIYLTVYWAPRF